MLPWILLCLTAGCAYLTYDAFRLKTPVERVPFSVIASQWKGGLSHLSAAERAEVKQTYARQYAGEIGWLFLLMTIGLAVATVRAFVLGKI